MQRRVHLASIVLFAVFDPTFITAQGPPDPRRPDDFLTYYYLYKNVADVPAFLKSLQSSRMLEKHPGGTAPTSAFLSVIFAENPKHVEKLFKGVKLTGNAKKTVMAALWMSGNVETIEKVFSEIPEEMKSAFVPLLKRPIKLADDLDLMWGAFLASGNTAYVNRVIDALDESRPLSGDAQEDFATRGAAEWSLKSNAMQHELVHRLIRKEVKTRPAAVRTKLHSMLNAIKVPSFPDKDGEFSAALCAVEREVLEEFKKSEHETPRIRHYSVAHRGDIVGLKLIYVGIELTEDLNADVRYDLKFLDPDGKPYDETDLKDLEGTICKVPSRFRVFDNAQVIMIRFEDDDKLGTYQIVATVRDKVGKRSIRLTNEIELKE